MVISTNGRNIPDVCHFKSLAPTTAATHKDTDLKQWTGNTTCFKAQSFKPTFGSDFALPAARMSVEFNLDRHVTNWLVHT